MKDRVYTVLVAAFVVALLLADVIGGKFLSLGGRWVSAGMLTFPVTFLLTDLLNEFWGKDGARRATWIGLWCAVAAFVVLWAARVLPAAEGSPVAQEPFDAVFGVSVRVYVASLSAYCLGQVIDIAVFGAFKRATGDRLLWARATGSTLVSQFVDSFVVMIVFLAGATKPGGGGYGWADMTEVGTSNYAVKVTVAVALTPLIYLGHGVLRKRWGLVPASVGRGSAEEG